jgi:hypothetical protein
LREGLRLFSELIADQKQGGFGSKGDGTPFRMRGAPGFRRRDDAALRHEKKPRRANRS